jgi:hypothetical protein
VHSFSRRVNGTPCDGEIWRRVVERSDQVAGGKIRRGTAGVGDGRLVVKRVWVE